MGIENDLPFGNYSLDLYADRGDIPGIGGRTSLWSAVEAFVKSVKMVASRVAFGSTAAIVMTTFPDDNNSGIFTLYDSHTETFKSITFENQENFNVNWFDYVMRNYELDKLLSAEAPAERKPVQSHGKSRNARKRENRRNARLRWEAGQGQNSRQPQDGEVVTEVAVAA